MSTEFKFSMEDKERDELLKIVSEKLKDRELFPESNAMAKEMLENIIPNYQCHKCGKSVFRLSDKKWMNSYCEEKDVRSRLYRINK